MSEGERAKRTRTPRVRPCDVERYGAAQAERIARARRDLVYFGATKAPDLSAIASTMARVLDLTGGPRCDCAACQARLVEALERLRHEVSRIGREPHDPRHARLVEALERGPGGAVVDLAAWRAARGGK